MERYHTHQKDVRVHGDRRAYATRLSRDGDREAFGALMEEAEHYLQIKKLAIINMTVNMRRLGHNNITTLEQYILPVDKSCNKSLVVQNVIN